MFGVVPELVAPSSRLVTNVVEVCPLLPKMQLAMPSSHCRAAPEEGGKTAARDSCLSKYGIRNVTQVIFTRMPESTKIAFNMIEDDVSQNRRSNVSSGTRSSICKVSVMYITL